MLQYLGWRTKALDMMIIEESSAPHTYLLDANGALLRACIYVC